MVARSAGVDRGAPAITDEDDAMTRSGRWRALCLPLLAAVILALAFPLAASAAASPTFTLYMKVGECFSGTGPPDAEAAVIWRNASGDVKASFSTMSDATHGNFYPPDTSCVQHRVEVGDRIKVSFAAYSLARTFVVPPLSIRFDRATNIIRGAAPANDSVQLRVSRLPPGRVGFPLFYCEGAVSTGATPKYSVNATALTGGYCPATWDPIGGDDVILYWRSGHDDTVILEGYAHFVRVLIGGTKVAGAVDVGQSVSIESIAPGGAVRGTADTKGNPWFGLFNPTLRNGAGNAIRIRSGDRIRGNWAGPVAFTVPDMDIAWDATAQTVRGRCMANVNYQLVVYRGSSTYSATGTTGDAGRTALITTHDPVAPGDNAVLTCARPSGDSIRKVSVFG
jgi:hypothetical protein